MGTFLVVSYKVLRSTWNRFRIDSNMLGRYNRCSVRCGVVSFGAEALRTSNLTRDFPRGLVLGKDLAARENTRDDTIDTRRILGNSHNAL